MKRFTFVLAIIAVLTLSGCITFSEGFSANITQGSGRYTQEIREVSGFNQILLTGAGEAVITVGDKDSLTIQADDNILPLLSSEVVNGKLILGTKSNTSYHSFNSVRYTITVKDLSSVEITGSLNATLFDVKTSTLALTTGGSGNITAGSLQAEKFTVTTSGSGNITVVGLQGKSLKSQSSGSGNVTINGGKVDEATISTTGSGNFSGGAVESQTAQASTTGSGKITLWVKGTLNATTTGSGDINYYGAANVTKRSSGSGKVNSLGNK